MAETVFVRSALPVARDGGSQIVLWETHPDHPGGEALIAGELPVKVARTPEINLQIRNGRLVELSDREAQAFHEERRVALREQLRRDLAASNPNELLKLLDASAEPVKSTRPRAQSEPNAAADKRD